MFKFLKNIISNRKAIKNIEFKIAVLEGEIAVLKSKNKEGI